VAIKEFIPFVKETYKTDSFIPLHQPTFSGNEKQYLLETVDSTFVSSVGKFVGQFEDQIAQFTGAPRAVATVNGTAALHMSLLLSGVQLGDLVITQALTFVATCNAIKYLGADPVFVDVSKNTMGMCPIALEQYLQDNAAINSDGVCCHKKTGKTIRTVVPVHTFGHPVEIDAISDVCKKWHLKLVEDAAESLGSTYKGKSAGTFGEFGAISFNGNKIITTGSGGMVLCQSDDAGCKAKHLTTTAKVPHPYDYFHDEVGYNYRLANLNAALGCAQMEQLENFVTQKRELARHYQGFFEGSEYQFVVEPKDCKSNYWLNTLICPNETERNHLLETANKNGVMVRPAWKLMHRLPMYKDSLRGPLDVSEWLETLAVNIPSTPVKL
jgi:aminotransferase in exopolysaccharide biosynthesis